MIPASAIAAHDRLRLGSGPLAEMRTRLLPDLLQRLAAQRDALRGASSLFGQEALPQSSTYRGSRRGSDGPEAVHVGCGAVQVAARELRPRVARDHDGGLPHPRRAERDRPSGPSSISGRMADHAHLQPREPEEDRAEAPANGGQEEQDGHERPRRRRGADECHRWGPGASGAVGHTRNRQRTTGTAAATAPIAAPVRKPVTRNHPARHRDREPTRGRCVPPVATVATRIRWRSATGRVGYARGREAAGVPEQGDPCPARHSDPPRGGRRHPGRGPPGGGAARRSRSWSRLRSSPAGGARPAG